VRCRNGGFRWPSTADLRSLSTMVWLDACAARATASGRGLMLEMLQAAGWTAAPLLSHRCANPAPPPRSTLLVRRCELFGTHLSQ
jgi:hypothetical protein